MDYLPPTDPIDKLKFRNISSEEVERMLAKILAKKSFSLDLISNKTLKFIAREISWPLSHLVNEILYRDLTLNEIKLCSSWLEGG
jgi:hypothetical protein